MSDVRHYAQELLSTAVPADKGDPIFEEVTQGRAGAHGYSSCGDLCHWVLYNLGFRDPKLVNREEAADGLKWESGMNIAKLVAGSRAHGAWVPYVEGTTPKTGDIVLIGIYPIEPEHVFVVAGVDSTGLWLSGDYGQVNDKGAQCGRWRMRGVSGNRVTDAATGKVGRTLVGWIDLEVLEASCGPSPSLPSAA